MSKLLLSISPVTDLNRAVEIAVESGYTKQEICDCLIAVASKCSFMAQDIEMCPEAYGFKESKE